MIDDGFGDSEILEYMKNELWISDKKARLALEVAKNEEKLLSDKLPRSVSPLYRNPVLPDALRILLFCVAGNRI